MARHAKGRDVHGILLLDKPVGISSNAALQRVKRIFQARKAGHTGSLDNLASGLLPLCLGEATKISGFLLDADKHYRAVCELGATTTTGDAEGEVIERREVAVSRAQIEALIPRFSGTLQQIPPMYSALKRDGQPLYKLARKGIEVPREPRQIEIYQLTLESFDGKRLALYIHCSKGTYIRTLAADIGEALGCGAHIAQLRRTQVGPYADLIDFATLERTAAEGGPEGGLAALDQYLLPMESALEHWPALHVSAALAAYLRQGQPVQVARAPTEGWVRLFAGEHEFIGLGEVLDDGRVAPRRVMNLGKP